MKNNKLSYNQKKIVETIIKTRRFSFYIKLNS